MSYTRRILVVCGYGCHLTPELTEYLDRIAAYIRETGTLFVILCGGFTQRDSASGISEAAAMAAYLRPRVDERVTFILREDSYLTVENIADAAIVVQSMRNDRWQGIEPREEKVVIFCETQRALKVLLCAWYLMPVRVSVQTVSWERANPILEFMKTGKELVALFIPPFRWLFRFLRIRRAKRI